MLSILLPTYCYDVCELLHNLKHQLEQEKFSWEIRVYDDCSPEEWKAKNRELEIIDYRIVYQELPENLGRARIRNLLAREARYDNLLFLDADSGIPENFIANYRPFLGRPEVISGGRIYTDRAIEPSRLLHWCYGSQRESKPSATRIKSPYHGFQTNNFIAPKTLLLDHPFDEEAVAYGHEDTLWGFALQARSIEILHLDNPVAHLGLEDFETFLQKQEQAVNNLKMLEASHPELPTRLSTLAKKVGRGRVVLNPILKFMAPHLRTQLAQDIPGSLYYLDALKLYWYWKK